MFEDVAIERSAAIEQMLQGVAAERADTLEQALEGVQKERIGLLKMVAHTMYCDHHHFCIHCAARHLPG